VEEPFLLALVTILRREIGLVIGAHGRFV
jgi:hypothetical protein